MPVLKCLSYAAVALPPKVRCSRACRLLVNAKYRTCLRVHHSLPPRASCKHFALIPSLSCVHLFAARLLVRRRACRAMRFPALFARTFCERPPFLHLPRLSSSTEPSCILTNFPFVYAALLLATGAPSRSEWV